MFADAGLRHTPEPVYVRFGMLGLFSLGLGLGLLGAILQIWSLQLSLDAPTAGNIFLVLAAGLLPAFLLARKVASSVGPGTRLLFALSGTLATIDLVAMSFIYDPALLIAPMFVLGIALGGLAGAVAALLSQILTEKRAHQILNLAGVSFCLGGLAGCLLVRLTVGFVSPDGILRLMAVLPLLAVAATARAGKLQFRAHRSTDGAIGWAQVISPSLWLLGLSLLLQAAAYGIVGCWLTVYLSRALGLTTRGSLAVLLVFWGALTVGRVVAARMPPLRDSISSLVGPTAAFCLGFVFLLQTRQPSGATVGAALLGLGLGAIHPLTLRMVQRRYPVVQQSRLSALMFLSLAGALLACWPVGRLMDTLGIGLVIWAALGCSVVASLLLLILVIENRVSGESAVA